MVYDHADPAVTARRELLQRLGLSSAPDSEFDRFAADLARDAHVPYAMVNFITDEQHFAGLYSAPSHPAVSRTMTRDHGYCPDVIGRTKALTLANVLDSPRFSGNPVVDEIGISSYVGAPLRDPASGLAFGTVCLVGTEKCGMDEAKENLALLKSRREALLDIIGRRAG